MNILILTRKANKDANSIYNSYSNGITNNYPNTIVMDYFDLYFQEGKSGFENRIFDTIKEHKIDLIFINFVSGDMTFDLLFLKQLSEKCFMLMNFYDTELFFEPIDRYYAQCADLVILPTSSYFTYSYSLLGIEAISTLSLFDTKLFKRLDVMKDIDISFVGDVSKKSRQDFLNHLIGAGYNVEVFGHGTKNGSVSFEKMLEIFSRSKINLNFSDTVDERTFNRFTNTNYSLVPDIMRYMTQIKGRSIEAALCGGFVLTQYATGIEELFDENEIGVFNTKEELVQKIEYYLHNDALRTQMQNNAYKKALEKYDATVAFSRILKNLDIDHKKEKVIYTDREFLSNYVTYHTLYIFNFLFKLKFHHLAEELTILKQGKVKIFTALRHLSQQFHYQVIKKIQKRK